MIIDGIEIPYLFKGEDGEIHFLVPEEKTSAKITRIHPEYTVETVLL